MGLSDSIIPFSHPETLYTHYQGSLFHHDRETAPHSQTQDRLHTHLGSRSLSCFPRQWRLQIYRSFHWQPCHQSHRLDQSNRTRLCRKGSVLVWYKNRGPTVAKEGFTLCDIRPPLPYYRVRCRISDHLCYCRIWVVTKFEESERRLQDWCMGLKARGCVLKDERLSVCGDSARKKSKKYRVAS